MSKKTIHAVYENGLFRPIGPVDLPDPCEVEFEPRAVNQPSEPIGDEVPAQADPRTAWDEFFANPLVVGSAAAIPDEDDLELTGDDLLF